jgi:hypothetical protein
MVENSAFENRLARNTLRTILNPEEFDGEEIIHPFGGEISVARVKTVRDIVVDPTVPDAHVTFAVFPSMKSAFAIQQEITLSAPFTDYAWTVATDPHLALAGELVPTRPQIAGYVRYHPISQIVNNDAFEIFVPIVAPLCGDGSCIPGAIARVFSQSQALLASAAMMAGNHLCVDAGVSAPAVAIQSTSSAAGPLRIAGIWTDGTTLVRGAENAVGGVGSWPIALVPGSPYLVGWIVRGNALAAHYISAMQLSGVAGDGGGGNNDYTGWNVHPAGITGQYEAMSDVITDYFIYCTSLRVTWTGSALAAGSLTGARVFATEHPAYGDSCGFLRENSLSRMAQSRNDSARKGLFTVMYPTDPHGYQFRPWEAPGAYDQPGAQPYLAATIVPSTVAGEPLTLRLVVTHIVVYRTPNQLIPKSQAIADSEALTAVFRYLANEHLIWENPEHLQAIGRLVSKFGTWVADHYSSFAPVVRSVIGILPAPARIPLGIAEAAVSTAANARVARNQRRSAARPTPPAKPMTMRARRVAPQPPAKPRRLRTDQN